MATLLPMNHPVQAGHRYRDCPGIRDAIEEIIRQLLVSTAADAYQSLPGQSIPVNLLVRYLEAMINMKQQLINLILNPASNADLCAYTCLARIPLYPAYIKLGKHELLKLRARGLKWRLPMNKTKLTVSHAPFWHDGDSLYLKSNPDIILIATLPAVIFGILHVWRHTRPGRSYPCCGDSHAAGKWRSLI